MIKLIRISFLIPAHYHYKIWQMDVKIVFLNKNSKEEVYMTHIVDCVQVIIHGAQV